MCVISFSQQPLSASLCAALCRRYVYERLTPPGRKPTFMTLMVTQLVSGIWHGLYPGYIMFFAGACHHWGPSSSGCVSSAEQ